ncbi:MAG TPA: hypothetical protein VD994_00920, partial [Prosthecobacter sp.]|nr:hypothetical protein [Prosthecobacter sp.]
TVTVYRTASDSDDAGKEPARIKAVNSANVLHALGGRIGIATDATGDVATFGTINVTGDDAVVNLSSGVTLANLNITAGEANINNAVTTISHDGGTLTTEGTYNIATMSSGAPNATLNHRRALSTVTITRSGAVATVAWTSHGLAAGDLFMLIGAEQYQYNGVKVVATAPDANSVTFYVNGSPTTPATGTITATLMAITTLNVYDGCVIDISDNAAPFAVGTINVNGDATIIVNSANPNHFAAGYIVKNRGTLNVQG